MSHKYSFGPIIGKGATSTVYRAQSISDNLPVCVKVIDFSSFHQNPQLAQNIKFAQNEVDILNQLKHPNIIQFYEAFIEEMKFGIVMELLEGESLRDFIRNQTRNLDEQFILKIFVQLLSALNYCHQNNLLHRDIKPDNIFITNTGLVKLLDFGFSKMLVANVPQTQTFLGTPQYMPPEIVEGKPYSYPADIWSLGCVVHELTTFQVLFSSPNEYDLFQKILHYSISMIPSNYSKELNNIIQSMLNRDPHLRPSFYLIQRDPLILNFKLQVLENKVQNLEFENQTLKENFNQQVHQLNEQKQQLNEEKQLNRTLTGQLHTQNQLIQLIPQLQSQINDLTQKVKFINYQVSPNVGFNLGGCFINIVGFEGIFSSFKKRKSKYIQLKSSSTSSYLLSGNCSPERILNYDRESWESQNKENSFVSMKLISKKIWLTKYLFRIDVKDSSPINWRLEASNDGINWNIIDVKKNQSFSYDYQEQVYQCQSDNHYSTFKITMIGKNSNNDYQFRLNFIEFAGEIINQ